VRYLDTINPDINTKCFILAEPGQGFLVPVLQRKFPASKIIVLHLEKGFPQLNVPTWQGEISVQDFLEKEIPDVETSAIKIIEWRPSLNYYGRSYLALLSDIAQTLKRIDAGRRTTAAFGTRWLRNFFKNLELLREIILYRQMNKPIVIAGAGPGLEKSLSELTALRERYFLIAASSALLALNSRGIRPDMIITADGGGWALQHIYPYFRQKDANSVFAVNLCAALPSQCTLQPLLLLNDASLWQNLVLHELSLPSVLVSQKGTVTALAVELALQLTTGGIFLAGVDLSLRDIRSHARPYSFDRLFFEAAFRCNPVYSQYFNRAHGITDGGSLSIYAAWFKNQLNSWPKRIYGLSENESVFQKGSIPVAASTAGFFTSQPVKYNEIKKRALNVLLNALQNIEYQEQLKGELAAMLMPGKNPDIAELTNELLAVIER
jgi:hypothetical protein